MRRHFTDQEIQLAREMRANGDKWAVIECLIPGNIRQGVLYRDRLLNPRPAGKAPMKHCESCWNPSPCRCISCRHCGIKFKRLTP